MFSIIRRFFPHYSKKDILHWLSILGLMMLMIATHDYIGGCVFAGGLLVGSFSWLANLHNEISETSAVWDQKSREIKNQGEFSYFIRKSKLELWGYWTALLIGDWIGLFFGNIAASSFGLWNFISIPLAIISISGVVASFIYFLITLYRLAQLKSRMRMQNN